MGRWAKQVISGCDHKWLQPWRLTKALLVFNALDVFTGVVLDR